METLTTLQTAGILGSLGVGGFLVSVLILKLFSFLEKREGASEVNRAIIDMAGGIQSLTRELKNAVDEIKDGFKENNTLLRECRDWHRDNNATLGRIDGKIESFGAELH